MKLETYQIYVLAIAEHQNLTKAAKSLEISQPALSMALGKTEKKLGFPIFDRSRSPLIPTPEGQIYLKYLKKEQLLQRDFNQKIADLADAENAVLTVGAPSVYAQTILVDALEAFRKEYPLCRIVLREAPFANLVKMAQDGEVDCFVSTSENLPDSFEKQVLKPERIYLCTPAEWAVNAQLSAYRVLPGKTGPAPEFSLLEREPFIFLEPGQPLQVEIDRFLRTIGLTPHTRITVNQIALGVRLVARGLGMMFTSEEGLIQCSEPEKLCLYPLPDGVSRRIIYAAYDKSHYLSAVCRQFLEILKKNESSS